MDDETLSEHLDAMRSGEYELDRPEFVHLKSWHGVVFQAHNAQYALSKLESHEHKRGDLSNIDEQQALFAFFVVEYGKCFASAGIGQVTLYARNVFAGNARAEAAHGKILTHRNRLVAHNGGSELVRHTIAVKEERDRFDVRHFTTTAMPYDELAGFQEALETLTQFVIVKMNKHLDSLETKLGKVVRLNES